MKDIASELIEKQEKLAADRSTAEEHWQEIAEIMFPRQNDFYDQQKTEGEKRSEKIVDGTAQLALERSAHIVEALVTPRGTKWHGLKHPDERVNENQEAAEWYDRLTDKLFQIRYSPKGNFGNQQHETYMSQMAFGTGVKKIEELPGRGIIYKSSHIAEHFFVENRSGIVDSDWRKYRLSARQAAQTWGLDNLPEQIQKAYNKNPSQLFWFLHCVFPNEDKQYGRRDNKNMAFSSFHVAIEGKKLLGHGGFRTFPYIISRYSKAPNETYGRSPAMTALAEAKMLNQMRKTDLRARHLAIDPIVLTADQQTVRAVKMKPRHIVYGGLSPNGEPLVKPFDNRTRIDLSNDAIQQSRDFINDVFFVKLFQTMVENPSMTATQVLELVRERNMIASPALGRIESEDLANMIDREIDILSANGLFDEGAELEMPQIVRENGAAFEIEYTSPLANMRKSEEALGAQRTVEAALPIAQIDPSVLDSISWDDYIDIMASANGAPARLFKSDEEVEAIRQGKAQKEQAAMLANALPQISGSIKDIADAQAVARG